MEGLLALVWALIFCGVTQHDLRELFGSSKAFFEEIERCLDRTQSSIVEFALS
jgi:hypothetical protein